MSLIEGIGDEVTAVFVIIIIIALATLVTFIGNGSQIYSPDLTPQRIETLLTQDLTTRDTPTEQLADDNSSSSTNNNDVDNDEFNGEQHHAQTTLTDDEHAEGEASNENALEEPISSDTVSPDTTTAPEQTQHTNHTEAAPPTTEMRVRLKYLDDTERTVITNPKVKVGVFKGVHFAQDLSQGKIVRLIFCGQLLRDNYSLRSYRVVDHSVLHVQVLQPQTQQNAATPSSANTDLDLSHLLWPLLCIVLGLCWVTYFKFPEYFSTMSLGILLLFTGGFVITYSHVRG